MATERCARRVYLEGIASPFFPPQEVETLRLVPAALRAEALFNCWTRKEAFVEAEVGLWLSLDTVPAAVKERAGTAPGDKRGAVTVFPGARKRKAGLESPAFVGRANQSEETSRPETSC